MRGWLAVALALLPVLAATLLPGSGQPIFRYFATEWLADALLNAVLFIPLGAALAAGRAPLRRIIALLAAISGAIELAQLFIPGRDSSPLDLVANTAGGVAGALLLRAAPRWVRPEPRRARHLALGAAAGAAAVILLTGLLTRPQLPDSSYYAQWTPSLGHLEWYRGRVLNARFGGADFAPGLLRDSAGIRRALREGPLFEVAVIAGPETARLASLVSIYDHWQREIILLGPDGDDMVLRLRTRAAAIGLAQPSLRWRGITGQVRPGDTLSVRLRQQPRGYCLEVNRRAECLEGYRAGSGWSLLRRLDHLSSGGERALSAAWLALLVLPAGFWMRRGFANLVPAAILAASLVIAPLTGLAPPGWWEAAGLLGGLGVGMLGASFLREA